MKKSLSKKTILYTHPVFVIGSYNEKGVPNIMAVSWGGICCSEPPCVAISLRKATYSYSNIMTNKAFTVNIPPEKYLKEADYAGIYSGREQNKFEVTGLTPIKSDLVYAPYVKEFPLNLICKVKHIVDIGLHTQFIGEIVDSLADEEVLNETGLPMIEKIQPFIYNSATRTYYGVGQEIKKAYSTLNLK
jgi:flavin reductase (DIM6/NTAB) family NADH-FMN oxidoreductase RutF